MEPHYGQTVRERLSVRALTEADLDAVLDIERQGYSFPWSEAVFRDCFRSDYRLWALCDGDRLIGYAVVAYLFDEAHLLNLCVAPGCRRSGGGRYLLRCLVTESARDRMEQVILEVRDSNRAAIELYRGEGFTEIGTRPGYYPSSTGREDAVVMALGLKREP